MAQLPQYNSSKSDHPFGMLMPGRSYSSTAYKYGFNGKEKDDEVMGAGNSLDFGARLYDSRLGKWLSVDFLSGKGKNISLSTYNFSSNSPIARIDIDGNDDYYFNLKNELIGYTATSKVDNYYIAGNLVKSPEFNIVKVYVDPVGIGHTAIGFDGKTVGFYPGGGSKAAMYGTRMTYRKYSSNEFENHYPNANIFFLHVTPEQKNEIVSITECKTENIDEGKGPNYSLFIENCTTQVEDILHKSSALTNKTSISPTGFNSDLKNEYEASKSSSQTPVKEWMDRGCGGSAPGSQPMDTEFHSCDPVLNK